jgi:hypothetical protein
MIASHVSIEDVIVVVGGIFFIGGALALSGGIIWIFLTSPFKSGH